MKTRLITAGVGISIVIVVLLLSQFVSPLFTTIILSLLRPYIQHALLTVSLSHDSITDLSFLHFLFEMQYRY